MLSELLSRLQVVSKEAVGISREHLSLLGSQADRAQLIKYSDHCLWQAEGTVVKADIGHFTLLIKLLLLKLIHQCLSLSCMN